MLMRSTSIALSKPPILAFADLPDESEEGAEGDNIFAQASQAHMAFGAVFREPITEDGVFAVTMDTAQGEG
jgi:hypothetical protein